MKDEIKEILEELREQYNTDSKLGKEIANEFGKYQLNYKELTLLLDYITNLQEENEKVHKDFDELSERYFFTKSRNEKAIEFNQIVLDSDYVYSQDEIAQKNLNILQGGDE